MVTTSIRLRLDRTLSTVLLLSLFLLNVVTIEILSTECKLSADRMQAIDETVVILTNSDGWRIIILKNMPFRAASASVRTDTHKKK